jgi:allantoicase
VTASFLDLVDLASARLGAVVVAANDEFFAPKENLIKPGPAVWRDGEYTERGKWMDGWETRRRRGAGDSDWCVIRLGAEGVVRGADVDTAFFKGNFPESCALDACDLGGIPSLDDLDRAAWREILPRTLVDGDAHNVFRIDGAARATHVRLRIFPDGGVARLRVYGEVVPDWSRLAARGDVDLAAVEHGGLVVAASDMFFGSRHNLIMPGDASHMGDGWETKRRRGPGHDWTIVRLGSTGVVRRIEVDTRYFKGNAPAACSMEARPADPAAVVPGAERAGEGLAVGDGGWLELLPRLPLGPDARHVFEGDVRSVGEVFCVRFNIFPDGGVGRLRVFGRPSNR